MVAASNGLGVEWSSVLEAEHQAINVRRKNAKRPSITASDVAPDAGYGSSGHFDTSGLAFSGGGIRSAAFCLGAVQALAEHKVIDNIDYLSTVSGGGYIGSAITAALKTSGGIFPFQSQADDMRDPPALGHLRDHSNYLVPRGKFSLLSDIAIMLRGLVTNVLLVFPIILLAAALTIYLNPTPESLKQPYFHSPYLSGSFAITLWVLALAFFAYILWSLYRSVFKIGQSEFGGWSINLAVGLLLAVAAVAFCELQPVVVGWMHDTLTDSYIEGSSFDVSGLVKSFVTFITPIVAIVSLYAKQIGEFLKTDEKSGGIGNAVKRFLGKAVIWLVALALPLILWMVYLLFVYWGIPGAGKSIAPSWLWALWYRLDIAVDPDFPAFAKVYGLVAIGIIVLTWPFLSPNANSLHRLYRDRLSEAFLASKGADGELVSLDLPLSKIDSAVAPYHLVNAALNIQGSPEANARGRNADFFFFSRLFCGSKLSGYLPTAEFEKADPALTLGTAMAISGAAISSNMGASSISHMAPTLALLNLRLGYWLRNPKGSGMMGNIFYLAREMLSRLRPTDKFLYLTDGGHVDNTGLYELLRRRCGHIVVIDAEADPAMSFGSFVKLQRHARIDLGVRFNLRWDTIATTSIVARNPDAKPMRGPHCAVGEILYSEGGKGTLIYVKSSLSGDENVYVRDYARRNPDFPHETTADQFFSEEQFEVYRALGFHCVHGLYKPKDRDEVEVSSSGVEFKGTKSQVIDRAVLPLAASGAMKKGKR